MYNSFNMSDCEPLPGAVPTDTVKPKEQVAVGVGVPNQNESRLDDIEQIKKDLTNPRTISKKTDPEGRTEAARSILKARADTRSTRENITEREQKIEQVAELTSSSYKQERQKANELKKRTENVLVKAKKLIGIGDKQAAELQGEIDAIKTEIDAHYSETWQAEYDLKELRKQQTEIPNPR